MTTKQPDNSTDQSENGPRSNKVQNSYLALGIVFMALGVGLAFGDSIIWVVFFTMGVVFLAVSISMKKGRKARPDEERDDAP